MRMVNGVRFPFVVQCASSQGLAQVHCHIVYASSTLKAAFASIFLASQHFQKVEFLIAPLMISNLEEMLCRSVIIITGFCCKGPTFWSLAMMTCLMSSWPNQY